MILKNKHDVALLPFYDCTHNVSTTIMWREKQPYPVVKICRRDHPRWVTAHKNNHKMSDTTKNKHKVTDTQFSVKT